MFYTSHKVFILREMCNYLDSELTLDNPILSTPRRPSKRTSKGPEVYIHRIQQSSSRNVLSVPLHPLQTHPERAPCPCLPFRPNLPNLAQLCFILKPWPGVPRLLQDLSHKSLQQLTIKSQFSSHKQLADSCHDQESLAKIAARFITNLFGYLEYPPTSTQS